MPKGIINMDINSMYPCPELSRKRVMPYEEYKRIVNGIFGDPIHGGAHTLLKPKEVNEMGEPYLNRYTREDTDRDIHFLFEIDNWNGKSVKDMTSSHIINSALMLLKRATEFKLNYELFVLDNANNKLLIPKDNIEELAKKDATEWIKTTPIFVAFVKELTVRKQLAYFNIVLERLENGAED